VEYGRAFIFKVVPFPTQNKNILDTYARGTTEEESVENVIIIPKIYSEKYGGP